MSRIPEHPVEVTGFWIFGFLSVLLAILKLTVADAPRTGGESPLFNSIFGGLNFGNGVVENTTLTGQRPFARTPRRERRLRTATLERLSAHLTPPTPAPAQPEQSSGAPVFPENYIIPDPQYASVSLL